MEGDDKKYQNIIGGFSKQFNMYDLIDTTNARNLIS